MSNSRVHPSVPMKATQKQPLAVSNVTHNIDKQNPKPGTPTSKRMSKDTGNDCHYQPPDKRRKTDTSKSENFDDWDDDDFTEDQLENIDEMVMLSQQVPHNKAFDGNHNNKAPASLPFSSRALGRGTTRSQSASDVRVQSFPTRSKGTGGGARLQATPTAGASGQGGPSPGMPVSASSSQRNKGLEDTLSELRFTKKENETLKVKIQSKEGHIKVLTTKQNDKDKEHYEQIQAKNAQLEKAKTEKSEREKNLQKEVDRLMTQLQFKEREAVEMRGNLKRFEQRVQGAAEGYSPRPIVSPRRPMSPRQAVRSSPRVAQKRDRESTPVLNGRGFPNQTSFLAEERRTPVKRSLNVTPQSSPAKPSTSKTEEIDTKPVESVGKRLMKMKLHMSETSGKAPNASLVSRVIFDSSVESPSRLEGLINLLHTPLLPAEIADVKLSHQNDTFTSTNRLIPAVKSKGSPTVPKKINVPSIVTPLNCQLAMSGLTLMLESDQADFEQHCSNTMFSATSEHAVLILPVLDRYLSCYVWVLKNTFNGDISKLSSTDLVPGSLTQNTGFSLDSLTSSIRSLLLRGENVANTLEACGVNALKVLYNLVKYSPHVREALICDTNRSVSANIPVPTQGPSAITSAAEAGVQTASAGNLQVPNDQSAKDILDQQPVDSTSRSERFLKLVSRKLNIRQNLIRLAQPSLENKDPAKLEVVLLSLKILKMLLESCKTPDQFQRFDALMHSPFQSDGFEFGPLLNCFTDNNKLPKRSCYLVIEAAIEVMTVLAKNLQSIWEMCSKDECLLSALYNLHHLLEGLSDSELKSKITFRFVVFLNTIGCQHKSSVNLLFQRNCKCTSEVVKGVVVTLHEELLRWRRSTTRTSTEALRQGTALLHCMYSQEKLLKKHREPVSPYYKELLLGLEKLIESSCQEETELMTQIKELSDSEADRKGSSSKQSPEPMEQQ